MFKKDKKQKKNNYEQKILIKLEIFGLEDSLNDLKEIKELKESVQKADSQIRQAVFNHIFNNIESINKIAGGNIFLNIIANESDNFLENKLNFTELSTKKEELEAKLIEKKDNDQSLEEINKEIIQKEQYLLDKKKELLNVEGVFVKWQANNFTLEQANSWADFLKNDFNSEKDFDFCAWLRDIKNLTSPTLQTSELASLRKDFNEHNQKLGDEEEDKKQKKLLLSYLERANKASERIENKIDSLIEETAKTSLPKAVELAAKMAEDAAEATTYPLSGLASEVLAEKSARAEGWSMTMFLKLSTRLSSYLLKIRSLSRSSTKNAEKAVQAATNGLFQETIKWAIKSAVLASKLVKSSPELEKQIKKASEMMRVTEWAAEATEVATENGEGMAKAAAKKARCRINVKIALILLEKKKNKDLNLK
ncbi:MAG: hypothetical protein GBAus27B_000526 [Mycoplasmataceae bacterium]|nr:MAG: hypothetical protein GBAus27B_000526 [Mycoplasmataceae bacterium]